MMTKDTTVQHVGSTLPVPSKHVGGVFDSLQEGEQAVQELVDAGYHSQDITFIPSQDFPSSVRERSQKDGFFRRIMHQLQLTTDEGTLAELHLVAARAGSHFIAISVPQREHVAEVSAILFKHGARLVRYIGTWSIEDLFSSDKEENVSAEVTTGMGDEPKSDNQQPGPLPQPSTSTQAQDRGSEQGLCSTAAEVTRLLVMAARSAHDDAEKQDQLRAFLEHSRRELSQFIPESSQYPQQTNAAQDERDEGDEQGGQEMNIEQAHQLRTAQYTGKPGVKAPSYGQAPGSAG
jgi:hypothetical protein